MKLNQNHIKKLQKEFNKRTNENEEKITTKQLENTLNNILTNEEKKLFNQEKYFDILPILYAFEGLDNTGILELVCTYEHECILTNDCGFTGLDDPELIDFHKHLKTVWTKNIN